MTTQRRSEGLREPLSSAKLSSGFARFSGRFQSPSLDLTLYLTLHRETAEKLLTMLHHFSRCSCVRFADGQLSHC